MGIQELLSDLNIHYCAIIRNVATSINLTLSQALHLLSIPHGGISMSDLANKIGLDPSTLTRNIQSLETAGYVVRNRNVSDKRIFLVYLSKQGADSQNIIEQELESQVQKILINLDIEKQETLMCGLEEFVWKIDCMRQK